MAKEQLNHLEQYIIEPLVSPPQIPVVRDGDLLCDGLPAVEFWVRDPADKIETPLDRSGIVDVKRLIRQVKQFISPEYAWNNRSDVHHLQWPRADYVAIQATDSTEPAFCFRELPSNKMYTPRVFHNVIHTVTVPPPMPEMDVMRHSVEAWRRGSSLSVCVKRATIAERLYRDWLAVKGIGVEENIDAYEITERNVDRHMRGVTQHLAALEIVPKEYWPFNPELEPQAAGGKIGRLALRGYRYRLNSQQLQEVA